MRDKGNLKVEDNRKAILVFKKGILSYPLPSRERIEGEGEEYHAIRLLLPLTLSLSPEGREKLEEIAIKKFSCVFEKVRYFIALKSLDF